MEFREYAANEASELAARLTKAATTAAELAVKQARDEAQKVADGLRGQLDAAVKEKSATAAQLKDSQGQFKESQAQLKESQAQTERVRGELKTANEQTDRVRGELKTAGERIEAAGRQLDDARRTAEKLEATRVELTAARDDQAAARRTAETDLKKARETADALRGELASAMKTLERAAAERLASEEGAAAAHSHSEAAEAKLVAVTDLLKKSASRVKTLEQAQSEHEQKYKALETKLHDKAPAAAAAGAGAGSVLDELLAGFQSFASAATIGDVLTTLVEQMAAQFPRVALFRVKKGHLQGEHQIGFDLKTDIGKLVLPLGMDSLPARAASSGQMEMLTGDELKDSRRIPFSGSPACAVALPIVVNGETLAIVYADDSGAAKPRGAAGDDIRGRYAETVRHYAVALLMRLTNELKALAELQKYAASLLHEMEQMYVADAESGLTGPELQKRLAGNLDFARSIYGSRTALDGADAASLIEDELASLIDARKGTPFGRDLEAARRPQSAAEAS